MYSKFIKSRRSVQKINRNKRIACFSSVSDVKWSFVFGSLLVDSSLKYSFFLFPFSIDYLHIHILSIHTVKTFPSKDLVHKNAIFYSIFILRSQLQKKKKKCQRNEKWEIKIPVKKKKNEDNVFTTLNWK